MSSPSHKSDPKPDDVSTLADSLEGSLNLTESDKLPKTPEKAPEKKVLTSLNLEGIAEYIKKNKCQNIIVATGAGISTSAGIPDFRTPGTGLYDNLKQFKLDRPEDIFTISYFRENPEPFTILSKGIFPSGEHKPTVCHYFIKLLAEKDHLLRNYTQNVDTLERLAGVPGDFLVEAHGSYADAHCIDCLAQFDIDQYREEIFKGTVVRCEKCMGLVKPDVVFFGEGLPKRFFTSLHGDAARCDLLIVIGTSLKVQPFANIINIVRPDVPRLLINLEKVGEGSDDPFMKYLGMGSGFSFAEKPGVRDVFHQSTCDDGCLKLAELLGWKDELLEMVEAGNKVVDEKWAKLQKASL